MNHDALIKLAEAQTLSLLAVRFLHGTLATGRNLLVTGPVSGCLPLMTALVAQGDDPGLFSRSLHGGAPHHGGDGDDTSAPISANDRLGVWQQPPAQVAQALLHHVGVVAHLPAGRLDRALMRLELALISLAPSMPSALAVLAAVDVVVVLTDDGTGAVQVREIYELVMGEEGYRPAPLFVTGVAPVPHALVPCRMPSFAAHLTRDGQGALVADLTAAVPQGSAGTQAAMPTAEPAVIPGPRAEPEKRQSAPAPAPQRAPTPQGAPRHVASAPGWELDQHSEPTSFEQVLAAQTDAVTVEGLEDRAGSWAEDDQPGPHGVSDEGPLALEPPPMPPARS